MFKEKLITEECFTSLNRNLKIGLLRITHEGDIISANLTFSKMLGYDSIDEVIESNYKYPGIDSSAVKNMKSSSTGIFRDGSISENVWQKKDGTYITLREYISEVRDKQEGNVVYEIVAEDVTKCKKLENVFEQNKKIINTFIQNSTAGVFHISANGNPIYLNPTCYRLSGITPDELPEWSKSVHKDDLELLLKEVETAVDKKRSFYSQFRFCKKDGSIIWFMAEALPIKDSENNVSSYIGILIDITKIKLYENELNDLKKTASISDKLKDEFLSQISHEIRTPINTIILSINYLKEQLKSYENLDIHSAFNSLRRAGMRIINTIDSMLSMAILLVDKNNVRRNTFDLYSDVMLDLYHEFKPIAEAKGLGFNLLCDNHATNITADADLVKQIFARLIDNAIKYTQKGLVEIRISKPNENLVVMVSDTGSGISKEFLPHIYEPFRQEEQGYTRSFDGLGLGLTFVKKYCELNNIKIEVESKKGKGSKFILVFSTKNTGFPE